MLDPILLAVLAMLAVIGSIIGVISFATADARPRRVALEIACGAVAALAVGFPAVSYLTAEMDLIGELAVIGSPEPLLLPLGAYLSGTLTSMGLGRLISL